MVGTKKSSHITENTENNQRYLRSSSKNSENVQKSTNKGEKAAKVNKTKKTKKTSVQRLQDDENAETLEKLTLVEQVLAEEGISIAPPPHISASSASSASIQSTQTPVADISDTLNEDEILMPSAQSENIALDSLLADKTSGNLPESSNTEIEIDNTSKSEDDSKNSDENLIDNQMEEMDTNARIENAEKEESELMDVDIDITPKKSLPVLKRGCAPSSPTDNHHSISKVSRRSESHSSATSGLSKDELQGESHTMGGFSCGHAAGNTYNYGDDEEDPFIMPPENNNGKIHLFLKSDAPKANFVISDCYSPIAKKNARISLHENDNWSLKGCYLSIQEKKTSTVTWQINDKNKYVLEILAEGADTEQRTEFIASGAAGPSTNKEEVVKNLIISHFNIPDHLIKNNSKDQDIHITYEKYEMIEDIWNNKKPSLSTIMTSAKTNIDKKVLIGVFISPSTYYTYAYKIFPLLEYHPQMTSWMKKQGGVDKKCVWGSAKPNFQNLNQILLGKQAAAEEEKKRKSKGKGKEREESEEHEKKRREWRVRREKRERKRGEEE
ncbi:hypothetical protein BDQ17DRAFT_1428140 [Cyathus striatus]|nr:hypothetical protein BDQ17DRAFT_1428140 [Cyathus striatus]